MVTVGTASTLPSRRDTGWLVTHQPSSVGGGPVAKGKDTLDVLPRLRSDKDESSALGILESPWFG